MKKLARPFFKKENKKMDEEIVPKISIGIDASLQKSYGPGEFFSDKHAIGSTWGSESSYALFHEEKTKPHWPPPEPIRAWVSAKLARGEMTLSPGVTAGGLAFLVGRKISREGTPAFHDLADYFDDNWKRIITGMAKVVEKATQQVLKSA